ncbi:MAG: class I SAM-dependent methyltransferase [Bacteroidota bacterium]|nr:class I SAM-dependent methyltransferase [Bacteroidota bacterium]
MKLFSFLIRYLLFYFKAICSDKIVPDQINQLLREKNTRQLKKNTDFIKIAKLRNQLLKSEKEIQINDFGAGSNINHSDKRKIKDIVRNSAKNQKFGQLLYKIAQLYKPSIILELGTSLGISTCYLASGNKESNVITLEGCSNTAQIAKNNFEEINQENIEIILGDFSDTLEKKLNKIKSVDLVFIDGNHKEKSTISYFKTILKYSHEETIFIFDDIHWSEGMEKAWQYIKKHKKVSCSIDLFFLGIIFLDKEFKKTHSVVRF